MRPTPGEEIAGIRRILAEIVAPAVSGDYPASQLEHALTALDRLAVTWESALPDLIEENGTLSAALDEATLLFEREPGFELLRARIRRALRPSDDDEWPDFTFTGANERNQEYRGLLNDTILALEAAEPNPRLVEARDLIRSALRRNLDRALGG